MTEVSFHFNMVDPVDYAVGLLRTAARRQLGAVVVALPNDLSRLSHLLWSRQPESFFAHSAESDNGFQLSKSPIVLAENAIGPWPPRPLLINLRPSVPTGFERYPKMLDLVGQDEAARLAGRDRWKYYQQRGYTITRTDALGKYT